MSVLGIFFSFLAFFIFLDWYIKKETERHIQKHEKQKKFIKEYKKLEKRQWKKSIEYQAAQAVKALNSFSSDWEPKVEDIYDIKLRKLIKKINELNYYDIKILIESFRKSIDPITFLEKDELKELDNQLNRCIEDKKYLLYILYQDNINIISIGMGLDTYLKKRLKII